MYTNFSYFGSRIQPSPTPDPNAFLHFDANINASYPQSGSVWRNVGTAGTGSAYTLTITGSTFYFVNDNCSYIQTEFRSNLGQSSAVLGASFAQTSQSTWLYCLNALATGAIGDASSQFQLIGQNFDTVYHPPTSPSLAFYKGGSSFNSTPINNMVADATGSFISIAILRTNTPVKRVELRSSVDNFSTAYYYSSSTANMNEFYDSLNNFTSVIGSRINVKSVKYYNGILSQAQLISSASCPNCN